MKKILIIMALLIFCILVIYAQDIKFNAPITSQFPYWTGYLTSSPGASTRYERDTTYINLMEAGWDINSLDSILTIINLDSSRTRGVRAGDSGGYPKIRLRYVPVFLRQEVVGNTIKTHLDTIVTKSGGVLSESLTCFNNAQILSLPGLTSEYMFILEHNWGDTTGLRTGSIITGYTIKFTTK